MGANLSQILPALQLGRLLHVGGLIQHYRGQMQLNVKFLVPEHHADGLSLFWLQTIHLHTSVYPTAAARPVRAPKVASGCVTLTIFHPLRTLRQTAPGVLVVMERSPCVRTISTTVPLVKGHMGTGGTHPRC